MTCSGKSYIRSYSAETNSTTELLKIQIVLESTDIEIKNKKKNRNTINYAIQSESVQKSLS